MDDILNIEGEDNLGGLQLIQFAPARFFTSLNPVTFVPGYSWNNIYCTTETMLFTEESADDDNCGAITTTITGIIPQIRPDVTGILNKYRLQRMIVLCQDNNGNNRLAGQLDSGLVLTDNATSGTATADANQVTVTFTAQQAQAALFV